MPMPFAGRWSQQICPFCFDPFRLRNTPFRCINPPSRCSHEKDSIREERWGDRLPLGKVIEPRGLAPSGLECEDCGRKSWQRLCPSCHMELPRTLGKFPNMIFAIIGARQAGKSHYIAVLVEQLRQQVGPQLGVLLESLGDETITRYKEDFFDKVYKRGEVIEGTRSSLTSASRPLVFTLTFEGKNFLGRSGIKSVISLVFFDTAGEDLDDEKVMDTVNKYIYRSDGIILLLDPLQLDPVRDQLGDSVDLPEVSTETRDILTRTTRLIERGRGLSPSKKIETPLALAFSKLDALGPILDPQLQLHADADLRDGYDQADFEAVNAEMEALLESWGQRSLVHQARTRYAHLGFFGLSALGCNPGPDKRIPSVLPQRVEDPFLWLLHHHGLLGVGRKA